MTSSQKLSLDQAFSTYTAKKADYENAVVSYNGALALNVSAGVKTQIVADAKNKMIAAKDAMDNSLLAYNTLKDSLSAQDQAEFNAANPTAAVQIAAAQAQAVADTAVAEAAGKTKLAEVTAKTELEAQTATFAAKNKQMFLYVGIGLTVLIVVAYVYFKFKGKAKP